MNLQEAVHNFLQKYALLGRDVLCGFSGGADSTSLLLALSREQLGGLTAVHFHHGIRGAEADADAEWSRAFCEKRGIRLELIYLNVPPPASGELGASFQWHASCVSGASCR